MRRRISLDPRATPTHPTRPAPPSALPETRGTHPCTRLAGLFAIDRLLLGAGFAAAASLVLSQNRVANAGGAFSRSWAKLGLFGAFLCFVGFILDVSRFASWRVFSAASGIDVIILNFFVLPAWLVGLAKGLRGIRLSGGVAELMQYRARDPGPRPHEVSMSSLASPSGPSITSPGGGSIA